MERFIGTWKLIKFEIKQEDGTVTHPLGENAIGTLIYTETGYMSAHLSRKDIDKSSVDEKDGVVVNLYANHFSYSGRYQVEENTVKHKVEISVYPN